MRPETDFRSALARTDIAGLLEKLKNVRVAVLGDLCLDVYWDADMRCSELSRETPHFPLPVTAERFSPGGAANVCANAAALSVRQVRAVGVLGNDWRAAVLGACCGERGVDVSLLAREPGRFTNAYCKPLRHGISDVVYEDPRLDFATLRPIAEETERQLLAALDRLEADVLCVSDQLPFGCVTERVRGRVMELSRAGLTVVADSRDRIGLYRDVIVKPNEVEGYRAARGGNPPEDAGLSEFAACASELSGRTGRRVFMTLGARGCLCAEGDRIAHVPAARPPEKIDFVGAGDTVLASLGAALAAGADAETAMTFSCLCASVTIGKLGVTGTASPAEILAMARRQAEGA